MKADVSTAVVPNLWSADHTFAWWSASKAPKKKVEKVLWMKLNCLIFVKCYKLKFTCKSAENNEMAGRKQRK